MQTYPELPKVAEETGWAITDEHILQRVHQYESRANWKLAGDAPPGPLLFSENLLRQVQTWLRASIAQSAEN